MVPLLVPVSVECGADIVGRIDELNAYTRDLNIVFEPFGSDTVLVRELPETLKDTETSVFLQDLVDRFRQDEPGRPAGRDVLAKAACDHLRLGPLNREELQRLADALSECSEPYYGIYREATFTIIEDAALTKELKR